MLAMESLKQWAKAEVGRSAALAAHLKVPASFVSKMISGEKAIPLHHMTAIERFTDGEVTRQQMCPDWERHWPELAAASAATAQPAAVQAQAGQGV